MLTEHRLSPLSGSAPKQVVIFLHGLGDRGDGGLLSICQMWQRALPDCEFLCPDAPFVFDMAPPDFGGRQWFSLREFTPASLEQGVIDAAPHMDAYIDHVLATRNLPPEKLALAGFSQGTMMALYVAPRRAGRVAGVLGYSGRLCGAARLKAEMKSAPPVLLAHGMEDEVVPFAAMAEAERGLTAAGIAVNTIACPNLGHSIDERGMVEGVRFLQACLA